MKARMSVIDIRCIVAELRQKAIGLRLANIYDLNQKTYLLKFSRPEHKCFVIVESGVRLHTTQFSREKDKTPSSFTMKIRKHIRTRRLEDVQQMGVDRVVDFTFGSGEQCYHLICEFYARGNIILTDHTYAVLALLRTHKTDDPSSTWAVHQVYPFASARQFVAMDEARLRDTLSKAQEADRDVTLKSALVNNLDYGPSLVEHCVLTAGLKQNAKVSLLDLSTALPALLSAFSAADQFMVDCTVNPQKGYITKKIAEPEKATGKGKKKEDAEVDLDDPEALAKTLVSIYDDFSPFPFAQYAGKEIVDMPSFDEAVDEFFSKIESQKLQALKAQQENAARKKLDKMRSEQQQRLDSLKEAQMADQRKAMLLQANLDDADQAILVVRSAVAQAVDWDELRRIIKDQKKAGNPIANIIHALKLETNQITLLLSPDTIDTDEDAITAKAEKVDVDISLSAFANATTFFEKMKKSAVKEQKTVDAADKAFKAAEKKTMDSIKQVQVTTGIQLMRKVQWFEKFNWFITSENYLVLSGRDAQQNEILVKRYLKKGDIYVHADIHGASSCVIKNPTGQPIPPLSTAQAGMMTVCRSSAWDAKIVTGAWWVYDHQVSKTAPSGEYLPTGSFMIRGRKNFIPPNSLVMGFGFMFKIDESCLANHVGERRPHATDDMSQLSSQTETIDLEDEEEGDEEQNGASGSKQTEEGADENQDGEEDQEEEEEEEDSGVFSAKELSSAKQQQQANAASPATTAPTAAQRTAAATGGPKFRVTMEELGADVQTGAQDTIVDELTSQQEGDGSKPQSKKRHLSTKERKLLKKGVTPTPTTAAAETPVEAAPRPAEIEPPKMEEKQPQKASGPSATAQQSQQQQKKRGGGKGKGGKRRGGDGWSSDEEKEKRAEALLRGEEYTPPSAPVSKEEPKQEKGKEKEKEKGGKSVSAKPQAPAKPAQQQGKQPQKQQPPTASTVQKAPAAEAPAQPAETTEDMPVVEGTKEEVDEVRQLLEDEDGAVLAEEDQLKLTELDSLTGCPLPSDILLFAIPVAAPYSAMHNYKYKVKLTPGTMKKGKAAKQALQVFLRESAASSREKELMKCVTDNDLFQTMLSDVKISVPGLFAMKVNAKKKTKSKASAASSK